jgi:predicted HTH domain antitoxin
MSITLTIPDEISTALKLPDLEKKARLLRELAIVLYDRGILSFGKARELARLSKWQFHDELGKRKIARHYGLKEFSEDLSYATGRK